MLHIYPNFALRSALFFAFMLMVSVGWGQSNYYWKVGEEVNQTTSWGTNTDGTGNNPADFSSPNQVFNIQNGQNALLSASWSITGSESYLLIHTGGRLESANGINPTLTLHMQSNATYAVNNSSYSNLIFGSIDSGSNFELNGATGFAPSRTYPNLVIKSGTINPGNTSVKIEGSLIINGGEFRGTTSGSPTHEISGSISISTGATWVMTNGTGGPVYNIGGSIENNGTIGGSSGVTSLNFIGSNPAATKWTGTKNYTNHNINIESPKTLNFTDNLNIGNARSLSVSGTLDFGSNYVFGGGNFMINSGGILNIGSSDGIAASANIGNVRVEGSRNFSSSARYNYNHSNGQVSGDGLPAILNNNGGLVVNSGGSGLTLTSSVELAEGSTNTNNTSLILQSGVTLTNNANISGTGAVTNNGTIAGTGTFGGALTNNGTVSPGTSAGTLTISGDYSSHGSSELDIELGGTSAGQYDVLNIGGTATLNGTLNILLINAYEPQQGDKFTIITAASINSVFSTVNLPPAFENFQISYVGNNVELEYMGPLPVELTRFDAREELRGVALSWETASELNNEFFVIQHSRDSRHWDVIGVVEGAGTTLLPQVYSFLHEHPGRGMHYYRLRQVDYDGAYAFSPVRAVDIRDGDAVPADWSVRPTLASDLIHLIRHSGDSDARWTVLSTDGRPILHGLLGPGQDLQLIEIDRLIPGIYFLQVLSREGVWTGRFQKI